MSGDEYIDHCDAGLRGKPRLENVFDAAWRGSFHREILAMAAEEL
jgi:hypothetical protein